MKGKSLILGMSISLASCVGTNSQNFPSDSPEFVTQKFSIAMYQGNLDEALSYTATPQQDRRTLQNSITKIKEMGGWKFYRVIGTKYSSNNAIAIVETQSDIPSLGKRLGGKTTLKLINGTWKIIMR